ncbi:MAG TPA: bifunctional oligoribonuclease/PAP phosphatase NrnA [Methylomirabilota bacterium]|nr:bifunctional oligoribonuclease/PAP phosphatase NrnA [Methylomirabilota bacterium]
MKSPRIVARILEAIRDSRTFCIVGHIRPDGDCIGSQLGLAYALRAEGRNVTVWNEDPMPDKLAFLDPDRLLQAPKPGRAFDCVIATDCASFERLGRAGACVQDRKVFVNIDHHASNTRYADLNWISSREPSTGELIYRLLRAAKWPITPGIANCLFTAVSTDTGSFQYPTTRPATYQVAGHLVERGADLATISNEVYQSYPLSRVRLVRHLYNKFRLTHDNRTAYFWLKKADYARTGAQPDDSEGLIDHIRAIQPVVVACLFEEIEPELTRISLRSKSDRVNVNEIAKQFGGGGHNAAAGARIPGRPATVQRRVLEAIKRAVNGARN